MMPYSDTNAFRSTLGYSITPRPPKNQVLLASKKSTLVFAPNIKYIYIILVRNIPMLRHVLLILKNTVLYQYHAIMNIEVVAGSED